MSSSSFDEQFRHLGIQLEKIKSATNNFSDANLIRGNEIRKEYKGQLLMSDQLIDIVALRYKNEGRELRKEVSMLSKLKHRNLVSMVGFCREDGEKIVINKHETHGSLDQHIRDAALTWMRRLHICVGVARALSYIHYDKGRDFSVIHRDIRSSKILLDEKWEAKLSGFELSITQTASRRDRLCLVNSTRGTRGYIDPTYIESGSVTHKSDIYSFGIVLFEVLCGKEATVADDDDMLSVPSARSHYEGGRLEDIIDPGLWKQMDPKSFKMFSETAYYCLKEKRPQRPNIDQVIIKLEQALVSQQEHDNPLISKAYSMVDGTTSKSLKENGLKDLNIPFSDIKLATKNFSKTYLIGSGTYGDVYKAELSHSNCNTLLPLEEKNTGELTKKSRTVAIKRILIREDNQGEEGFLAEIEMLTRCKHPNIVSLLGFCKEGPHMILVYEYAPNGSLDDYLGGNAKFTNLSWMQRIKICIDIARGLNYLHTEVHGERRIIHRDIKSGNILLGGNWEAKIADFGLSKFRHELSKQVNKTLYTQNIAGTERYRDPEYVKTGRLKNESDIYSFGVVLFEMLSGRFAHDPIYTEENSNGIVPVARIRFNEGKIREMVDPRLMEETHENILTRKRGPDQYSLDAFSKIAYQCVAESQAHRPTAEVIIKNLEEALSFQENPTDQLIFSLKDIELATQNFSADNLIGKGEFGKVYKGGEVKHATNGRSNTIAAKRLDRKSGHTGEKEFLTELQTLLEYKHENIIGLIGYCKENDERIIVYEYAPKGSLDKHLNHDGLTWRKRLEICIDIASGLHFLHGGSLTQDALIHGDINSSNILLTIDWEAKITDFGFSLIRPINKDMDFVNVASHDDITVGKKGYLDPLYTELGFLTQESDIYSFGVVLFEIFCGRLAAFDNGMDETWPLVKLVRHKVKRLEKDAPKSFDKLNEIVFEGIKERIAPKSLDTFVKIAYQCLSRSKEKRPTTSELLQRLEQALDFQDDFDIWKPKLPKDYETIIQMSNSPQSCSTEKYKVLYDMFSKGILLQEGKVLFSSNRERNEMISATAFSYKHRWSQKWRYVPESRFDKVAKMLDISNLKIQVKIKPQFLSSGANYSVHLVFKFCESIKSVSKRMYVNLKYKKGSETLHTYFATWREDGWMMIELHRFLNHKEDTDFEFLLESFSRCYCESHDIYIEGIEFRAIEEVKYEENKKLEKVQQVQKSNLNKDQGQELPTNFGKLLGRFENYGKSGEVLSISIIFLLGRFENYGKSGEVKIEENKKLKKVQQVQKSNLNKDQGEELPTNFGKLLGRFENYDKSEEVKHEENKKLKKVQQVQKSNLNKDKGQELPTNFGKLHRRSENYGKSEELFLRTKVNKTKSYMLSAKEVLYQSSDVKLLNSTLSAQSRSEDVIELLSQQVFRIKCKIECQRLSRDTLYACYLVFKLSEKCRGLHCPVIVRDLMQRKNKKKRIVYFRSPSPCNVNDTDHVPKGREDGWMEVNMWQFSFNYDLRNDSIPVNLKLISYEETMSGLIVSGLEFRPL